MPLPSILLGLLIALLIGSLFHLIRGGGGWRLLLYLVLSPIGFVLGHFVGEWRNWFFFPVGSLNLGMEIIGSIVFLIFGDWLSRVEIRRPDAGDDAV